MSRYSFSPILSSAYASLITTLPSGTVLVSQPEIKAITDSKGEYWLELKPGIYDVSIKWPSFKPTKRKSIKVEANGKSIVDFGLQPGKPSAAISNALR